MTLENVRQKALWNKQPQSMIALLVNSADGCLDTEHFPHTDEQTVNSQRCLVSLSNNGLLPDYKHTKHTQYLGSSLFNDLYSNFFFQYYCCYCVGHSKPATISSSFKGCHTVGRHTVGHHTLL